MRGINRANKGILNKGNVFERKRMGIKCVFISHQKKDSAQCKLIANYLLESGIDVYFDEYDNDLRISNQTRNAKGVVNAIKKGIQKSSHMLCVLSHNTLYSKWVPFEIGYGYETTDLGVLTLKDIPDKDIPDYIKTAPLIIRGTKSLNEYVSKIKNQNFINLFESSDIVESHTAGNHYLDNVLNWNL
ncbi:TIR domain-containing protein [Tenacibaculum sp. MAR_2010_89]|uniref:toll/interleukin-1 receptor domain-containing protein n=1 Tax=Tenacibaculum sp. MAR_2010_89 TaxID=1250198 RepID=UPI000895781B|nr:toll/interleukin-1 receptor domain-containing protein [Tenacibaculum sp. MAR_2010_89]SEE18498.1 TIR domain-containing protein [Tenacibaculum sp. MAR_2010_89]